MIPQILLETKSNSSMWGGWMDCWKARKQGKKVRGMCVLAECDAQTVNKGEGAVSG